ncbi:hypothetical protein [Tunicatimonas sp.]|uniref:hypothetical protein n=1 Tax=Tunicatimonas sp. TaxID=1940096 RepID=UPI003C7784EB
MPPEAQQQVASRFNAYLNRIDDMCEAIDRNRASGDSYPLTEGELLERIHQRAADRS